MKKPTVANDVIEVVNEIVEEKKNHLRNKIKRNYVKSIPRARETRKPCKVTG